MGQGAVSSGDSNLELDMRPKRLITRFRETIRSRHYSYCTEQTYWYWIRYFIHRNGKHHPAELGATEVTAFLSWLATERNVAGTSA